MESTAYYYFFADRFGWTKQQVDNQPHWYTTRLPVVAEIADEVQAEKQKAATKT